MERPRYANQVRTAKSLKPEKRFELHLLEKDGTISKSIVKVLYRLNNKQSNNIAIVVVRIKTDSTTKLDSRALFLRLSDLSILPKTDGTWESHSWLKRL
jgi:hypothetical protein